MNNNVQELLKVAEDAETKKKESASMFQKILMMLFAPGVQDVQAGKGTEQTMDQRQSLLQPQQTGGMFDAIYRKRMERENAIRDLLNQ